MMGIGFGGFGLLFMLFFILVIISLAVWFVSVLFPRQTDPRSSLWRPQVTHNDSPLDIIKIRYTRGEISKAEYEEMRGELLGGTSSERHP